MWLLCALERSHGLLNFRHAKMQQLGLFFGHVLILDPETQKSGLYLALWSRCWPPLSRERNVVTIDNDD